MGSVTLSLILFLSVLRQVKTGYINCGETACVDDEGVVCSASGRSCDCPPGMVGEARVVCADPASSCACILHGDPHVVQFTSNKFDLPLPCAHKIVDLTDASDGGDLCTVQINGQAVFSNPGSLDTRSREHRVDVKVTFGQMVFTASFKAGTRLIAELFNSDDTPITPSSFSSYGVDVSNTVDRAGYYTITVGYCDVTLKFRGSDGFFGLVTPNSVSNAGGICGECNAGETTPPSQEQVLGLMLDSLWRQSPVDGLDMNSYQSCTELTKAVLDCPEGRVHFARGYCQVILLDESIKGCIGNKAGNNTELLARYAHCYERVCNDGGTCSEYEGFMEDCGAGDHFNSFMAKTNFCFVEEK